MTKKLKVGQQLYFVPMYGPPIVVIVKKVGHKRASFSDRSSEWIDLATWDVHERDFGIQGKVYTCQEDYENERAVKNLWAAFAKQLWVIHQPEGATLDKIRACADILGIKL